MLLSVALCYFAAVNAQTRTKLAPNLVYNPSFEEYRECPRKIDALGTLTIVDAWYQPTAGSADYYNVCGSRDCGVPKNKLGVQDAHSGNGFCGIYCSKTENICKLSLSSHFVLARCTECRSMSASRSILQVL